MLTEEITTNALRLSAVDRIYLAEALLESLDITDSQVEKNGSMNRKSDTTLTKKVR